MLSFQLFRIKVLLPGQLALWSSTDTPSQVLERIIEERPSQGMRRGVVWHIGNVESVDERSLYYRFGKMTRDAIPLIDESTGDFIEREFTTAPYTHVLIDLPTEACAIASQPELAPDVAAIARQLARVLSASSEARGRSAAIEIAPVLDPHDFIAQLESAFSIKKFVVEITPPNPFDAHEEFQKPFERYVKATNGQRGKTEVKGKNLDSAVLQDVTRSAAATGNDASAWLQRTRGSRPEKKVLKGSSVILQRESVDSREDKVELVVELRVRLQQIREGGGHDV